jgi:hypothetical protein
MFYVMHIHMMMIYVLMFSRGLNSIKSSRASSHVISLKCSDVSRTNSVLIFRVVGGEWVTPSHHLPPTTLKMRTELVLEMSEHFSELTRLLAREDFIAHDDG